MHPSTRALTRQIKVPFHGTELFVVEHDRQPYAPMKPIVEGMGLDWGGQHKKLAANQDRWGCISVTGIRLPGDSQRRDILCLPLRKIGGWLMTVHASRVRAEIRDRIVQYQIECDDVLWKYWTEGIAINPRTGNQRSTPADRADALRCATELVIDRHVPYSAAYRVMRLYAGTLSFRSMTCDQAISATEFAKRLLAHLDTLADWTVIEKHKSELTGGPEQLSLGLHPRLGPPPS